MSNELTQSEDARANSVLRSTWYRMTHVLWSPIQAFAGITQKPRWLVPFAVLVVFTIGYHAVIGPIRHRDMIQDLHSNTELSHDEIGRRISNLENQPKPKLLSLQTALGSAVIAANRLVSVLALALVSWLLLRIWGASISFPPVLSIVCLSSLVTVPELTLRMPLAFATQTTQNSLSLAVFLPGGSSNSFIFTLLDALDVFYVWKLALIGVGVASTTNLKRSSVRWLVVILGSTGVIASVLLGNLVKIV